MVKSFTQFINETNEEFVCKYCGRVCKNDNSLRNHERLCKENPNRQKSSFVSYHDKIKSGEIIPWNRGKTKETCDGVRHSIESRTRNIESGKTIPSFKGKHLSDEHKAKLSKAQTEYLIRTGLNRWSNAHSSERSYPEKFFEEILKDICVEQYVIPGLPYKLDFADVDNKIDVEVDGEQHYINNELRERDQIRDKRLEENGWRTIRVRWSQFQKLSTDEKKEYIRNLFDIAGWSDKKSES